MDKKTLFLMLGEAVLIVVLVVVVAMDYSSKPTEETLVAHTAQMQAEGEKAAVAEETAAKAHEEAVEEEAVEEEAVEEKAVEEKAEEHVADTSQEKAGVKKPAKEEAPAKAEKPAAEKAPAKAAAAAGSGEVADIIAMNNPAYSEHTKPIAQFTHKKHFEEYKLACGACHHDENAEPLKDLKPGDPVEGCIACHDKPGKAPKGAKLSKEEELQYHTEAVHENCISCHRDFNRDNNTKDAPQTCGKCHVKEE